MTYSTESPRQGRMPTAMVKHHVGFVWQDLANLVHFKPAKNRKEFDKNLKEERKKKKTNERVSSAWDVDHPGRIKVLIPFSRSKTNRDASRATWMWRRLVQLPFHVENERNKKKNKQRKEVWRWIVTDSEPDLSRSFGVLKEEERQKKKTTEERQRCLLDSRQSHLSLCSKLLVHSQAMSENVQDKVHDLLAETKRLQGRELCGFRRVEQVRADHNGLKKKMKRKSSSWCCELRRAERHAYPSSSRSSCLIPREELSQTSGQGASKQQTCSAPWCTIQTPPHTWPHPPSARSPREANRSRWAREVRGTKSRASSNIRPGSPQLDKNRREKRRNLDEIGDCVNVGSLFENTLVELVLHVGSFCLISSTSEDSLLFQTKSVNEVVTKVNKKWRDFVGKPREDCILFLLQFWNGDSKKRRLGFHIDGQKVPVATLWRESV